MAGSSTDLAYRDGSIYHTMSAALQLWLAASVIMTCVLLAGLVTRQRVGPRRIGFESVVIIGIYVALVAMLFAT